MKFGGEIEARPDVRRRWKSGIAQEISMGVNVISWMNDLCGVNRFKEDPMICQTTLFEHAMKVETLAASLGSHLEEQGVMLDEQKLLFLARHHDDPEVITGDIISPRKAAMTVAERESLRRSERRALVMLAARYFPQQFQSLYFARYREMEEKKTTEAQVVDIADKLDGTLEVIRELRAGNMSFVPIFARYQKRMGQLQRYPIWGTIEKLPEFNLNTIPDLNEIKDMPRVINGNNGPYEEYKKGWQPAKPFWYFFSSPGQP